METLIRYRAYDALENHIIGASDLNTIINGMVKPATVRHYDSTGKHIGTYILARTDCTNPIGCYDYVALPFVDPYDAQPQPLPTLHSSTEPINSVSNPVGLHVSIIDLQAIALATQLEIRAQRKHDEQLYNDDTITELEWKARRHAHSVLSNTVQSILQRAELKAIALDTPISDNKHIEVPHSAPCSCVRCAPGDAV